MTNRIDDQNRIIEQKIEERRTDTQKQTSQREFASKLNAEKTTEKQGADLSAQSKAKSTADTKKSEKPNEPQPTPKSATPISKKTSGSTQAKAGQLKKADEKKEVKKSKDSEVKNERKKSEIGVEAAIRQKKDSELDDGEFQESDAFFQQAVAMGASPMTNVSEAQSSAGPIIPQEVIDQMVDQIYSSTNSQGLKELTIELKSGVLAGAQIQVSTNEGKVRLRFSSDDQKTKTLLRNSKGAIAKRLAEKNLLLSEFVVD